MLLITLKSNVYIIFALHYTRSQTAFSQGPPGLTLELFFKIAGGSCVITNVIFHVMTRFKILGTVGSIFQTRLTENWEEEEEKAEEESSNYKAICFSCKLKKEAYVLSKWKSLKLNKYKIIYTQNERFSGYASKVNLIPGGIFFFNWDSLNAKLNMH